MEGCGNSFVVLADLKGSGRNWQALSIKLLDKNFGIGGDGLMVVQPSLIRDFTVAMYNPDGSLMGMCGNGIRCAARFIVMQGLVDEDCGRIDFEVEGRHISCRLLQRGRVVRVDMGIPATEAAKIPVNAEHGLLNTPLHVAGEEYLATTVSMGNPHCVVFVADTAAVDCATIGPLFENHPLFPERTNVEFVERLARDRIRARVWERGAGLTMACGTGACASVVAGVLNDSCSRRTVVELPGGDLTVEWEKEGGHVFLTGPANEICSGVICDRLLA